MAKKKINYNGVLIEYDTYYSELICADSYEVTLLEKELVTATLMLTKKQIDKL